MRPSTTLGLTAVAAVVVATGVALAVAVGDAPSAVACLACTVAVAIGGVVARREPRSAVGPALAWSSGAVALALSVEVLARSSYGSSPLPLAAVARPVWVGIWPIHLAGVLMLLLVFPEGFVIGRRWIAVPVAYAVGVLAMVSSSWGAREVDGRVVGGNSGAWGTSMAVLGLALIGVCLVLAVASVVVRYRCGDDRRREQIRWLTLAGATTVALLVAGWLAQAVGASIAIAYTPFLVGVVVLVPLAVGIAIVRHDLFDVDRILSAAAAWTLTLVASAMVFAAVVLFAGRVVGEGTGLAPSAAAFVTALTLLPLQRYLTAAVGRFVDHDRFVAVAEVEAFAAQVRSGRRAPEEIEDVLRTAQRDPMLQLFLTRPEEEGWSDLTGARVEPPGGLAVQSNGKVIARIVLGHDSARARRRVSALARAGWVPIEVSRLRLALREALAEVQASRSRLAEATVAERKRLERDLHDGVQPHLVATGMRLRSLQHHGLDSTQAYEVDLAVAELESTIAEIRRLAHGIRPSRLDDGLGAALASLGDDSPVPMELTIEALPELDDSKAMTAYFVVAEAVTNALKHAHANRIVVAVRATDGCLTVEVRDDGLGGVPQHGLTSLRDRVHSLGGSFGVDSAPGLGTTVRAVL